MSRCSSRPVPGVMVCRLVINCMRENIKKKNCINIPVGFHGFLTPHQRPVQKAGSVGCAVRLEEASGPLASFHLWACRLLFFLFFFGGTESVPATHTSCPSSLMSPGELQSRVFLLENVYI